ncbi:MAG: serine/threonine protein kinase [Deltaproteobacteria bacterium]|nr:MAG: serine/threonine protein kinase [Deltaproteobacteria bacterium]
MNKDVNESPTGPTAVPSVDAGDRAPIGLRVKGRYRIVSELGAGAFGTVCAAEDEATGHPVAIRFLPRALAGPHAAQTIQRTGRSIVAASTGHPGLVRVLEFGEVENGRPFVAMELVEGRRLSEMLSGGTPLDIPAALRLALDLGGSVETLHNMGLVHGALRPCNVMVLQDGRIKLMDLELAGLRDAQANEGLLAAEAPAEYLSPEQIRRAPATEKTDIYAFGVILYEMLCGVPPFQAPTRDAVLSKQLTETPTPMRRRRRAVPASVEAAVALALYKQPELRPLMQDVLNRLWAETHGPVRRWKRKAAIVGGTIVTASIAAIVVWGLVGPRLLAPRPSAQSPAAPSPAAPSPDRGPTAPLAQPTPPPQQALAPARPAPATERATVGAPPTSSIPAGGPVTETRTAPPVVPATPAPHAAPRSTPAPPPPPSPASPPPRAERRVEPRTPPQAPAGAASERRPPSPSNTDTDDPGAIIDWLLKRSSERDK